jgi:hypothetical protein
MVLPIHDCDSGSVGISRWLNAQKAPVALSKLQHPLICFPMLGVVHVSVDRCENDCVVGALRSLRYERHHSILLLQRAHGSALVTRRHRRPVTLTQTAFSPVRSPSAWRVLSFRRSMRHMAGQRRQRTVSSTESARIARLPSSPPANKRIFCHASPSLRDSR